MKALLLLLLAGCVHQPPDVQAFPRECPAGSRFLFTDWRTDATGQTVICKRVH